ncbi:MAG TPA: TonB family protein [Terriglobales bacterium]|jgi:TonB family protein|nr:TonB family protein [Terriglobales bacterium]
MRACPLIASGILIACASLFGQNSPSSGDSTAAIKNSERGSGAEHGIYTSGFEILNRGRNSLNLGQYPDQFLATVRSKWYAQIPNLQKSVERKRGITVINFEINHNGSLRKVTTAESAGDASLDNAASQAILSSAPALRLPEAYLEKTLKIRMHFGYDQPATAEAPFCDGPNLGAHPAAYALHHVGNGVTPPKATYSPDPEFSEKAREDKYMSTVMIAGTVDPRGAFTDLCVTQAAGEGLDEKALEAVRTWKFEPASLQGGPVAVRLTVEVTFRLY